MKKKIELSEKMPEKKLEKLPIIWKYIWPFAFPKSVWSAGNDIMVWGGVRRSRVTILLLLNFLWAGVIVPSVIGFLFVCLFWLIHLFSGAAYLLIIRYLDESVYSICIVILISSLYVKLYLNNIVFPFLHSHLNVMYWILYVFNGIIVK